jgi:hypothetical protein
VFHVADGSPDEAKVRELLDLPEVKVATRDPEGSFCMVGAPFTATSVDFVEAALASTPIPPAPGTMP